MFSRSSFWTVLWFTSSIVARSAETPAEQRPPQLNDPGLRIEALCRAPDIEAPATVAAAPDGSFYVGCDPRDTRLNTKEPVCTVIRYSSMGADKKRTVFAEKLYSPAGSAWHDGWLYIVHNPLMSRFKDTDGDGVADLREDLITNLGVPPQEGINDHVVSGLTLGMDGFFYISVGDRGIYQARSVKEAQAAEKTGATVRELSMEGGGVIRCRPDGTQLEIFSTGTRNHLSVLLDAEDNVFTRDNTDDGNGWWSRVTHHVEGGYYGYPYDYQSAPNNGVTAPSDQTKATARGGKGGYTPGGSKAAGDERGMEPEVISSSTARPFLPAMADFGGGSPTGGVCYMSDGLPEQYRGKLLFSEWGKSTLFATEVARDGATFKLVKDTPLVKSDGKMDFRPMEVTVANDGSLLIADWGWGGWKADRIEGVIWRVSWPEAKPAPRLQDETKATVGELVSALAHPDRGQRLRAQGELIARGENTSAIALGDSAPPLQRFHALWTLEGQSDTPLGSTAEERPAARGSRQKLREIMERAKQKQDVQLLIQSIRALGQAGDFYETDMAGPTDAELRRHAVIGLGRAREPEPDLASAMVRAFADEDPWIRAAAEAAFRNPALTGLIVHQLTGTTLPHGIWPALASTPTAESVALLGKIVTRLGSDVERKEEQLLALQTLGENAFLPKPYTGKWWGTQPTKEPRPLASVAWEETPRVLETLTGALEHGDADLRGAAAKAFTRFVLAEPGSKPQAQPATRETTLAALRSRLEAEPEASVRQALIEALATQRDARAMPAFLAIARDDSAAPEFRISVINAISTIGGDEAAKTLVELTGAALPKQISIKLLEAVAKLKLVEAAPALIVRLGDPEIEVREKAIKALASIGPKANATAALIGALKDEHERIRMEAMSALGTLKDKAALPPLLALAQESSPSRENRRRVADHERGALLRAIGSMADATAVPVLVDALTENVNRRRDVLKPLKILRTEAWPLIEQRLASGAIPAELGDEIRAAFQSGTIAKWRMIGPFENVWGAVHPPEADALARGGAVDLAKEYHNALGKVVGWREVVGEGEEGRVNLERVFDNNGMVSAYAYTPIEAAEAVEARILCGSDDQIAIWVNGEKVHDISSGRGFEVDSDTIPVQLRAGMNHLLVKIGNESGPWAFAARLPGLQGNTIAKAKEPAAELKQRTFALATKPDGSWLHAGDATRGEKLFFDQSAAMGAVCATCHAVKGQGSRFGPELTSIGTNYKRADLITSIHEPNKTIALGFEQVVVETAGGELIAGALRSEAGDILTILSADGQSHAVPKADAKKVTHVPASLMPPGLTLGLEPEQFTDLLAYLESLRGP